MIWMRGLFVRRLVATAFLLTGFIAPLQAVYACELMNGPPSTVCCCSADMADGCTTGGGCATPTAGTPNCCDIAQDAPPGLNAVSPAPAHAAVMPQVPEPVPALLPYPSFALKPSQPAHPTIPRGGAPIWVAGTDTYLDTLRLRI